jgi:hypothetical protein
MPELKQKDKDFSIKRAISYSDDPEMEFDRHLDYMISLSVDDRLRVLHQINKNTFAMQGIDYDKMHIKRMIFWADEDEA